MPISDTILQMLAGMAARQLEGTHKDRLNAIIVLYYRYERTAQTTARHSKF